jgi:hypothetical protein
VAERHRVRCITRAAGASPDELVARIGGTNSVGVNWRLSQAEAIAAIEAGRWEFYVEPPTGRTLEVIVARTDQGTKYLRTSGDEDEPTGLLALPDCT